MKHYMHRLMVETAEGEVVCVLHFNSTKELVDFLAENKEWRKEWRGCWTEDN